MFCTRCGKENQSDARFCFSCGHQLPTLQPVAPPPAPPAGIPPARVSGFHASPAPGVTTTTSLPLTRPAIVTLLAVLQCLCGGIVIAVTLLAVGLGASRGASPGVSVAIALVCGSLGALQLACGIGLWKLRGYGRTIQLVLAWIGLVGFPVGTVVSIAILLYLYKPGIKVLFSEKHPSTLTPEEASDLAAVSQGSIAAVIVIAIVTVAGLGLMAAVVAAIAVPGLLRARMAANEASAIAILQAINAGQTQHFSTCGGYAPGLLELKASGHALPQTLGATATGTASGYLISLQPSGPQVTPQSPLPECRGSVTSYVARADPERPGTTGSRNFATGPDNVVVQSANGPIADPRRAIPVP